VEDHFADPQKLVPTSIMPKYKLSPKDLENLTTYLFALPD
jgi:cbb3-type cytochrome oxidase cytochrome c subunit